MNRWFCLLAVLAMGLGHFGSASSIDHILNRAKRQMSDNMRPCDLADIVFVLDSSGSIKQHNWDKVKSFVASAINEFNIGEFSTRVGIITFGFNIFTKAHLKDSKDKQRLLDMVNNLRWHDSNTNTPAAIRKLYEDSFTAANGDRVEAPNIAIVITDGEPDLDLDQKNHKAIMKRWTIGNATIAKNKGIKMFAIGIGESVQNDTLLGIATGPNYMFPVSTFDALKAIKLEIQTKICEFLEKCKEFGDLVFLVDESGSIGYNKFKLMMNFVSGVFGELKVASDAWHVGLVTFGSGADIKFNLSSHYEKQPLLDAVSKIEYNGGRTETWVALDKAVASVFNKPGDRSYKRNIIVIVTDGGSNDHKRTIEAAMRARLAGVTILAVGVGGWTNKAELNQIASDPDNKNVYHVDNFNNLAEKSFFKKIKSAVCNDIRACDSNPCKNGATCVSLIHDYRCVCREGYVGKSCNRTCRQSNADVVFAVDSSGSIGWENFLLETQFVKNVLLGLDIGRGTQVGVQTFASDVVLRYHLNKYKTQWEAYNATDFKWEGGATNTPDAINFMRNHMYSSVNGSRGGNVRKIGVVITDGKSVDKDRTIEEARLARTQQGIDMIAVAVGHPNRLSMDELNGIATDPNDKNILKASSFKDLVNIQEKLMDAICNNVDECDPNPCRNSGICQDGINGYTCRCRDGFTGINCERRCTGVIDLAIVLDTSGSVHWERFDEKVKPFIKSIINQLEVAQDRTRVGVITWGDESFLRFPLNKYPAKQDVLQAIDALPFTDGRTNTASALKRLHTEMFIPSAGDRSEVPNHALILTDGQSNVNAINTLPEAILARKKGIHITVATIGNNPSMLEIKGIASDPDSANVFKVDRYSQLPTLMSRLVGSVCDDEDECEPRPCRNNGRCINGLKQYVCECPGGFTGKTCERSCPKQMDVAFIIDRSGSVEKQFELQLKLVKAIVMGLDFSFSRARVGVVIYEDSAQVAFDFEKYDRKFDVLNAIAFVQKSGGKTNTADGIYQARTNVLTRPGDRQGVDNKVVIVTDGRSNLNKGNTANEAKQMRQNAEVFAVGVGNNVNVAELNEIGSDPDSTHVFHSLRDDGDVQRVADRVLDGLCG